MSWDFLQRQAYIVKTKGKEEWCVKSETGKNMGCSDSHAGAEKRLREVEFFKHKKGSAYGPQSDLGMHGGGTSDQDLYHDPAQTDNHFGGDRAGDYDDYGLEGSSKGKQKPGGSTTMTTEQVMNREDMPKIDFKDPDQPSSEPERNTWDGENSKAPEGEMRGLQPSYTAVDVYMSFTAPRSVWNFTRESLFDKFIGNVGTILRTCRQHGVSRENARQAVIKVYTNLFQKHEWVEPMLERFLDRAYGTAPRVKSSLTTLTDSIAEFITAAHKKGQTKEQIEQQAATEFSSWIENYPETQLIIDSKMDELYGVKLLAAEGIDKFKKILIGEPPRSGVITEVTSEDPYKAVVSVFWLDSGTIENDVVIPEASATIQEPTADELKQATEVAEPTAPKISRLVITKNAVNHFMTHLTRDFSKFPLPYAEFRKWCSANRVDAPTLYSLERTAVELNYVIMPESLVVFADDKDLYVSEDKSKVQTLARNPDPTKIPEEITLNDGSKLKKIKE